jgi:hypothetical protein
LLLRKINPESSSLTRFTDHHVKLANVQLAPQHSAKASTRDRSLEALLDQIANQAFV